MRNYEKLGLSPEKLHTDIRGICHDEKHWYVSLESSIIKIPAGKLNDVVSFINKVLTNRQLVKSLDGHNLFKLNQTSISSNPVGVSLEGICFGDIDCYKGYLFVPTYVKKGDVVSSPKIFVFSTKTFDCVCCETLYKHGHTPFQKINWCAVNSQDECLYTSDSIVSLSFDGCKSPVMAYKINFDNIAKKSGSVFSCVNDKGVALKRKVGINTNNPDYTPYNIASEIKAGCFDPFDTLYLCSGSGSNQEHDGITAFALQREIESTVDQFIRDRAYYIWVEKGRPIQSDYEKQMDWFEAVWQINAVVQSGLKKFDGPAYAGAACVKMGSSDSTDKSLIDFSLDKNHLEEIRGITYWDLRRYMSDIDIDLSSKYGNLHVLKYQNSPLPTCSMHNYVLSNFETTVEIIDYIPESLKICYNKVSNRWAIVSRDSIPVKAFETEEEAKNALPVFSLFKRLMTVGRCASNDEQHDLCYDFLCLGRSNSTYLKKVKREVIHFDSFKIEKKLCVAENKWKSDYAIVMDLSNYQNFGESYQKIVLPIHSESDGTWIRYNVFNNALYTRQKGGYLNYIKSSSNRQKDNLYWFD